MLSRGGAPGWVRGLSNAVCGVKRATSRRPADRYPTASDMVAALRQACHPELAAPKRRTGLWWVAACLALALASTALAVAFWIPSARPLELPSGFVPAPGAQLVNLRDRVYPSVILCRLHGLLS